MYSVVQKTKIISHQFMQQTLLYTLGLLNGERNNIGLRFLYSIYWLMWRCGIGIVHVAS